MAPTLSVIAGKDGNGTLIAGGVQALDKGGGGVGPWSFAYVIADGVAGTNLAMVNSGASPASATAPALLVELISRGTNPNDIKPSSGSAPVVQAGYPYEDVPASSSNVVLGGAGAAGDYLEALICFVDTPANSQVQLKDGSLTAVIVLPGAVAGGIGTYYIPFGIFSASGAWQVTTATGVRVRGVGKFAP